jgi:hypothetical protein
VQGLTKAGLVAEELLGVMIHSDHFRFYDTLLDALIMHDQRCKDLVSGFDLCRQLVLQGEEHQFLT